MTGDSFCPQCGTQREGDYRYCPRCGFDFGAGSAQPAKPLIFEEAAKPQPEPAWVTARHERGPKPAAMSTAEAFFGCIGVVAAGLVGLILFGLVGAALGFLLSAVFMGFVVVIRQALR